MLVNSLQRLPWSAPALLVFLLIAVTLPSVSLAKDEKQGQTYAEEREEIARERQYIAELEQRLTRTKGLIREAVDSRLVRARLELLELNKGFVARVVAEPDPEIKTTALQQQAIDVLQTHFQDIETTRGLLTERIRLPEEKLSTAETAVAYNLIFQQLDQLNQVYLVEIDSIGLAGQLGLNMDEKTERLRTHLRDRAENGSILLEMATSEVTALRAAIAAVPDDADTKARLGVATANITNLTANIGQLLVMMESLDMNTLDYRNQLLSATGQITTDIFQVGVITRLFTGWAETLRTGLVESGPGLLFKFILLVIVIYLFFKLSRLVRRLTERAIDNSQLQVSQLLRRMMISLAANAVLIIGVLIALAQIGISLGPVLAGMGVVGFIVGFALQDTLANFAAGALILIYRPFDVDDYIEAGGVSGLVSEMSLVNTTFLTFDNQKIIVPNGKIWGDVIKNVTAQTIRRVDLVFGISYSEDIEKAEKVMAEVVAAHPAVLDEPETAIRLNELGDSSVNFVVRPWVRKDDYWETYWDLMRAMKMRFDEEGISIPFPQRDVHLFTESKD